MKRFTTILAGIVLTSNVLTCAAAARSKVTDSGDRLWRDGGSIDLDDSRDRQRPALRSPLDRYDGVSQAMDRVNERRNRHCYFPAEWPKLPPWPPFCN
jgi:hypothetical protein